MKTQSVLLTASVLLLSVCSYGQSSETNDLEKSERIKNAPEEYIHQGGVLEDASIALPAKVKISQKAGVQMATEEKAHDPNRAKVILTDQSSFPKFVNTGNAEQDNKVYAAAKKKWVAENYDLYNSISNNKEVSNEEFLKAHEAKKKANPEKN